MRDARDATRVGPALRDVWSSAARKMFRYAEPKEVGELIVRLFAPLGTEVVEVKEAVYRTLAEDVASPKDLPESDVSLVDGFAVSECDGEVFEVVDSGALGRCEAAYVETGQPVPAGAVAVAPLEAVRLTDEGRVVIPPAHRRAGEIVRRGADVKSGEVVLRIGEELTPPKVRLLAELGLERVRVYRRPRVLLIPVGAEFVSKARRESNSILVRAMCEAAGALVEVSDPVEDSAEGVRKSAKRGVEEYDAVATIGGASLGSKDLTLAALLELPHSTLVARGLSVQPGRVTSLVVVGSKPVALLPGLVQSAVFGAVFLLQPIIKRLRGATPRAYYPIGLYKLGSDYSYAGRFTNFTRPRFAKLVNRELLEVEVVESPSSAQKVVADSHGFVILEKGVARLSKGSYVVVYQAPGLYY